MSSSLDKPSFFAANRNWVIAGSVLLFHALAIWALQTGLLMRAVEIIVPVEVLAQIVELPTPKTALPVPVATPSLPVKQAETKPTAAAQPVIPTAPPILTVNEPASEAAAFVAPTPQPPAPITAPSASSVPVVPVLPATPNVAMVSTPKCTEDYVSQPKPLYPRLSKSLGEQGVVEVRVLFSPAGLPLNAVIVKSSGFARLDKSALDGTKLWRFVSCKNIAAATDHWETSPVKFELD